MALSPPLPAARRAPALLPPLPRPPRSQPPPQAKQPRHPQQPQYHRAPASPHAPAPAGDDVSPRRDQTPRGTCLSPAHSPQRRRPLPRQRAYEVGPHEDEQHDDDDDDDDGGGGGEREQVLGALDAELSEGSTADTPTLAAAPGGKRTPRSHRQAGLPRSPTPPQVAAAAAGAGYSPSAAILAAAAAAEQRAAAVAGADVGELLQVCAAQQEQLRAAREQLELLRRADAATAAPPLGQVHEQLLHRERELHEARLQLAAARAELEEAGRKLLQAAAGERRAEAAREGMAGEAERARGEAEAARAMLAEAQRRVVEAARRALPGGGGPEGGWEVCLASLEQGAWQLRGAVERLGATEVERRVAGEAAVALRREVELLRQQQQQSADEREEAAEELRGQVAALQEQLQSTQAKVSRSPLYSLFSPLLSDCLCSRRPWCACSFLSEPFRELLLCFCVCR